MVRYSSVKLATVGDVDLLLGSAVRGAKAFHLLDYVHSLDNLAEYDVLSV